MSHRLKDRRFGSDLSVSGWHLQFQFMSGYAMTHIASRSMGKVPYCFSRTAVKFQGHKAEKSSWISFEITRPVAAIKSLRFALYISVNGPSSNLCKYAMPILFADNSNIFVSSGDMQSSSRTNGDLNDIAIWLKVNTLSLNIKKTNLMIFTKKSPMLLSIRSGDNA